MAGLSKRFRSAGYNLPKHLLPLCDKTVFFWSIKSLEHYFARESFTFITLRQNEDKYFIHDTCELLGIANFQIVQLDTPTSGQAETIFLVTKTLRPQAIDDSLKIFNIDTIRPQLRYPLLDSNSGWIELFEGSGNHWSFARLYGTQSNKVAQIAEKQRISDWCSTGAYGFSSISFFNSVYKNMYEIFEPEDEKYVAPMLQRIIELGHEVSCTKIQPSKMIPCGTPNEYDLCRKLKLSSML